MQNKQLLPVTSLEQFAELTAQWFFTCSEKIDALVNFPAHEAIKVQDNTTGAEKVLTGLEREAFIDGLKVAATIFDKLPFEMRPVDAEGQPVNESEPEQEA